MLTLFSLLADSHDCGKGEIGPRSIGSSPGLHQHPATQIAFTSAYTSGSTGLGPSLVHSASFWQQDPYLRYLYLRYSYPGYYIWDIIAMKFMFQI